MTKVHPNIAIQTTVNEAVKSDGILALTVWKKSLLFNCNGFTVFDANGNLAFRVDNYMTGSSNKGEILLMDAAGNPLLTIRRKRLSLGDNWEVYEGETASKPRFLMRKHMNILNGKSLAHVSSNINKKIVYEIEGSYADRSCVIYDEKRKKVGEIRKKEGAGGVSLGVDVFRLFVHPEMEASVGMAIVILLDQMFGSSKIFST